jgi:alkyl sulfatase BDS1-like metallo-beta-lactamase superfamily hydrolase
MGGAEAIISKAQSSYDKGEYRWVAEVLNHLVFAEPENKSAKNLLAASYQQMAYQAESAPWRDVYLTAGLELQEGTKTATLNKRETIDLLNNVPTHEFFKSMATQLKADDAEGVEESVRITFTDTRESYVLTVKNSVLHYTKTDTNELEVSATLTLTLREFLDFQVGIISLKDLLTSDNLSVEGSTLKLLSFLSMLDSGFENFNIVTP